MPLSENVDGGPCSHEEKMRRIIEKKFRSKQLDICKTRTDTSSLDVFPFKIILAGQDMVTDAGLGTTCERNFKAPCLQTKVWKMKDLSKTWVLTEKSSNISNKKK